ncbi:hypothetical protein [Clostridium sp.]|uniref:hypothetical protein n=1 Tax=Clostridium sp. TaxID=1506 RepID=UPI003F342424
MSRSVPAIETLVNNLTTLINKDLYLGALNDHNITATICFDCSLWNVGYVDNTTTPPTVIIPPIKTTISDLLDDMISFVTDELSDASITDYGFKTQLERFLDVLRDLKNKINSIQCNDVCSDITLTAQLLATLVVSILQLVAIFEVINGLLAYIDTCGCIGSKLFELLMAKFVNSITDLQVIMQDWYGIVMTFFQYSAVTAKSYVASYMPRQQIIPPPMPTPMGHACVPCPPKPPQPCAPCGSNNCVPYPPYC